MYAYGLYHDFITPDVFPAMSNNPITFAIVARLWSVVANVRYRNMYGEDSSRLDRTIRIYDRPAKRPCFALRCVSLLLFGLPETINKQLDEQLVDGIMIAWVWSAFTGRRVAEWQTSMHWTFALIVYVQRPVTRCHLLTLSYRSCNALAVPVSSVPVLTHASLAITTVGLLVSILLQHRFKSLSAADVVDDAVSFILHWHLSYTADDMYTVCIHA